MESEWVRERGTLKKREREREREGGVSEREREEESIMRKYILSFHP